MNAKKLAVASAVIVALAFLGTVFVVRAVLSTEFKAPYRSDVQQETPRAQGLSDEAAAKAKADREKPYVEEQYRKAKRDKDSVHAKIMQMNQNTHGAPAKVEMSPRLETLRG